ncbi:hypothetical protein DY052_09205 [Apilactobacillus timberlakei]|uniref:hypothetical protein n=1 Tax=Apilactobacillus timberlakei TaxID=2008380 RepID=UPI00112C2FAD|nr:hypothetical protein [Apilactobacillus timberlakei]TPR12489.1 hypothetical protein DY052_09205 [Apilactobacillus timberlakei]
MYAIRKRYLVRYKSITMDDFVETLEGKEKVNKGDILITFPIYEVHPIKKYRFNQMYKKINKYEAITRATKVKAHQLCKQTTIKTNWGYMKGLKGDFLVHSTDHPNDKWIIKNDIFKQTYMLKKEDYQRTL